MNFLLNNKDIASAENEVKTFLESQGVDSAENVRIRFGVEEALIRCKEFFGEEKPFALKCGKSLGKIRVTLSIKGEMFDPFNLVGETKTNKPVEVDSSNKEDDSETASDDSTNRFMRTALASMGDLPVWRYSLGVNTISFGLNKKHLPDWMHLIIAIVSAIVLGIALSFAPEGIREPFATELLEPILNTFMGFLGAMAGPMIFLEIVWGIYSIGDAATFNVLGKRLVSRYLFYIVLFTIVCGFGCALFFTSGTSTGEGESGLQIGSLLSMVLAIVPSNLFEPFVSGNTLQILFVAVIVGLAMLYVAEKTTTVAIFIEQIDIIVQMIMDVITKLVPFFVFGSLLDMIVSGQLAQVAASYKLLFANVIIIAFILLVHIGLVCWKTHTKFQVFFAKMLPTFIIGVTTASSSAAFATNRTTCSQHYGIKSSLADFGVPFGQVIYKPTVALLYFTSAICVAEMFSMATSPAWYLTVILLSVVLSVATAPLPGSALASLTMMFAQLGLPSEGMAVVLALNIVLDFLETPTDLVGGQCQLVLAANKFGMIDLDILHKNTRQLAENKDLEK